MGEGRAEKGRYMCKALGGGGIETRKEEMKKVVRRFVKEEDQ